MILTRKPRDFLCLDGMRGIAAIVVAFHHLKFGGHALPKNGFLAVDFFFALSGFVLAHAYASRLRQKTLGFLHFVVLRVIRLYPLYGLSIMIGAIAGAMNLFEAGGASEFVDWQEWWVSIGFSILFLPDPAQHVRFHLYPLNFPAWSLLFELLVNIAWAAVVLGRNRLRLLYATTLVVSAALLIVFGLMHGTLDSGSRWYDVYGALPRVFYSFTVGVIVYAIHRRWPLPQAQPSLILVALLPLLLVRVFDGLAETFAELAVVLVLFPMLLYLGANVTLQSRRQIRLFSFLGMISYPLYVLHRPLFTSIESGLTLSGQGALFSTMAGKGIAFVIALVVSTIAVSVFDEPVRSWLGRQLRTRLETR